MTQTVSTAFFRNARRSYRVPASRRRGCTTRPLKEKFCAIEVFLDAGLDVNWGRRDPGDTPLVLALNRGQFETAKYLLSRGADPNLGRCLIAALNAKANCFEMVKLLVENGVDVNQVWRFGDEERAPLFNALSWAIAGEQADIAEYLRAARRGDAAGAGNSVLFESAGGDRRLFRAEIRRSRSEDVGGNRPTSGHPVLIHRIGPAAERTR